MSEKCTTFKERYNTDEEFREKHRQYMSNKIQCPYCSNVVTSRANYWKHSKTKKHIRNVENKELQEKLTEIQKILKTSKK